MKLRKIAAALLALTLALCASASAQTTQTGSYTLDAYSVELNVESGMIAVQDSETRLFTLTAPDGTAVTTEPYIHMDAQYNMFEVAVEPGTNVLGMIDSTGKLMVPMQYGDVSYISDRWQIGVALEPATADNYDYKSFDGEFYLVSAFDVYFDGALAGSLSRTAYRNAYAYGAYLYVYDVEQNYTYYDSTMTASSYVPSFAGSSEYDVTRDGVFHKGSGQQAFTAGCTLTPADVETDLYEVDGRYVDLQGNEIFAVDAKYDYIYDFRGDYARVSMNDKYGLIDRTGREVIPCEYDNITYGDVYFEGGYQIAVKDGKVGFLNTNGEVTCEFKYSENSVHSLYQMPVTFLTDLDGSFILLSGAVGELPEHYAEVRVANNNCPLISVANASKQAGVVDMYGQTVIPMDGAYDDAYDFQISRDGSVIVGYDVNRCYNVYLLDVSAGEAPAAAAEVPAAEEAPVAEAPAADGAWICACGNENNGNFCSNCGSARPAEELVCASCGFKPEGEAKFCSNCGNAF